MAPVGRLAREVDRTLPNTLANLIACARRQDLASYAIHLTWALEGEAAGRRAGDRRAVLASHATFARVRLLLDWLALTHDLSPEEAVELAAWTRDSEATANAAGRACESAGSPAPTCSSIARGLGRRYSRSRATAMVDALFATPPRRARPLTTEQLEALPRAWRNALVDHPVPGGI